MTSQFDISRRRLLQLMGIGAVGAAGVGTLAACGGGDAEGSGTGEFTGAYEFDVDTHHYNVTQDGAAILMSSIYADLFLTPGAHYDWAAKKWQYNLIEQSSWDGDTFVVNIRKGLKWSDGSDLTSADFHQTYAMMVLATPAWGDAWPAVKGIEAIDEHTVHLTVDGAYPGFERPILKRRVWSKATFGEFGEEAIQLLSEGVVNGDEKQLDFNNRLIEFRPDDIIASGPFKIDFKASSDTQITMVPNKGGFAADAVKFDKVTVYKGANKDIAQMLVERKVDYSTNAFTATELETFKAVEGLKLLETPGFDGGGLIFNFTGKPELKDPRVRKALAYAIDNDQVGKIARGEAYYVSQYDCGLPDVHAEEVFTETELAKFELHSYDPKKAEELLTEAGWKKEDDVWKLPDGSTASYEIIGVTGWNDFELTATQVQEAWSAIGITCTAKNVPGDNPWGIWSSGEFEVAVRQWGNPFNPDYWGAFLMAYQTDNGRTKDTPGMNLDLKMESEILGEEVDLDELVATAKTDPDETARIEAVKKMAIVFNEKLPRIPVWGYKRLSPAIEGPRVKEFTNKGANQGNDVYQDNPVIISLLAGELDVS
ncbi:ABC transporter substrate-binding protein [Stackebrandtia soli]|uniref:ABC transporter substrate-binding protein n=1 Tax=Stackebrandtia soli TaxID=1892856 RepID=UPI0039E77559